MDFVADAGREASGDPGRPILYPVAAAALLLGLLWPARLPLPRRLLRPLAGSPDPRALDLAELRLRVQRTWVRVMPLGRRLQPFALPLLAPLAQWRHHRRAGRGLAAWRADLLPALRHAPLSPVPAAHGWELPGRRADAWKFLDGRLRNQALQMIRCLAEDCRWRSQHLSKLEFARRCEPAGLASVPVLAVFQDGRLREIHREAIRASGALFSKPASGVAARGGYEAWPRLSGSDSYRGPDGAPLSLDELIGLLAERSRNGRQVLLQPRLSNHPGIREVTGSEALCCVRIISCRFPDGRLEIVPGWSVLKVAPEGAVVDNVAGGDGLRYVVDLESGALRTPGGAPLQVDGGPALVPFWREAKQLCLRAHAGPFATLAAVGWDVAITPDGPVLVEGNATYFGPGTVSTTGPYCGEGPVAECLLAHLRAFDDDDLRRLRARCRERRGSQRDGAASSMRKKSFFDSPESAESKAEGKEASG